MESQKPQKYRLRDSERLLERKGKEYMRFLDKFFKKNSNNKSDLEMPQYLYSESELEEVDKYIG